MENATSFIASIVMSLVLSLTALSCASTTDSGVIGADRKQLMLVSESQINEMATKGYEEMKADAAKKGLLDQNKQQVARVNEIARRLIAQTPIFRGDARDWKWETHVITSKDLNAFCMPGGKMMVYSGLIDQLKLTDAELAAVMGHEIAHALREHGRERISEEMVKQGVLDIGVASGKLDPKYAAVAGTASALLLTLPHGRNQELEADQIGVELMARAGYDPEEALSLWKKMGSAGGGSPPEFLSTHPSSSRRLKDIEALLPKVRPLYKP
ncbi:MAG: M48 family metallopeptidase [Bdellovibrionaceae bacterium]|nr:M48 family metallopeptidase [Pseudobdellovibrionaceae bacterium]